MEDDIEMTQEASSSSNETPCEAENVHEQPTPEFLQRKIYFLSELLQSSPKLLTNLLKSNIIHHYFSGST